jgi:SAM-dependent methyltransferase
MAKITLSEAREYLTGLEHAGHPLAEHYLNDAVHRLATTINLVPQLDGPARVLELGAMPYFMTSLLQHRFPHYQLQLANEPGTLHDQEVHLFHRELKREYRYECKAFNIETDRFPYEDGSFDIVLYCEIIEHLMHDPSHSLHEIHRVLKPGGHMVLSTPNPFRYTNYLRLLRGENIYPPFSGYGPYARHNREFSIRELRLLLGQCNFEIEELLTAHDPAYDHPRRLDRLARWLHRVGMLRDQMDVIHLRARPVGKPVYRYPAELYLDVHVYQHIANHSVEMGVNGEAQLGEGFFKLESWPSHPPVRWTAGSAWLKLLANGHSTLGIRFYSGPTQLGRPVTGSISVAGIAHRFSSAPAEWAELRFPLPAVETGPLLIELEIDRSWVPREVLNIPDTRELGVAVQRVWLE